MGWAGTWARGMTSSTWPLCEDAELGCRKFWRDMLPKLKYHNPGVPINVNLSDSTANPATLKWSYRPSQASDELSFKSIDIKHKHSDDILQEFIQNTDARQVEETAADRALLKDLNQLQAEIDATNAHRRVVEAERKRSSALLQGTRDAQSRSADAAAEPTRKLRR